MRRVGMMLMLLLLLLLLLLLMRHMPSEWSLGVWGCARSHWWRAVRSDYSAALPVFSPEINARCQHVLL